MLNENMKAIRKSKGLSIILIGAIIGIILTWKRE